MYKTCSTAKSAQRQQSIQKALFLLMKTKVYSDISITELCQEAQVPRHAFYRYFDTMEDVLHGELDAMIREASLTLYPRPDIYAYFRFWLNQREFLDILEKQGLSPTLEIRAQIQMIQQIPEDPQSFPFLRNICFLSGLMGLMIAWHHTGMLRTPEEMEEMLWKIFVKP